MTPSISSLLSPDYVLMDIDAAAKMEAINKVIAVLARNPKVLDSEVVAKDVIERERKMSTGVGYGLALPHAKSAGVSGTVAALGITRKPIDFESLDETPVRLIFLLVGSIGNGSSHIRILSRVSRLMSRSAFRRQLLDCASVEEVLGVFEKAESVLLKLS